MRTSTAVLFAALAACVAAAPRAQADDDAESSGAFAAPSTSLAIPEPTTTASLPVSTSLNVPVTSTASFASSFGWTSSTTKRHPHSEPVPIFSKKCDCPDLATVQYPCYATDALQRCYFEENHSYVCWTSAARGCPYPTRSCAALFSPTPITGRHPCDPGMPEDPTDTVPPVVPTAPWGNSTAVGTGSSTVVVVVPTITSAVTGT